MSRWLRIGIIAVAISGIAPIHAAHAQGTGFLKMLPIPTTLVLERTRGDPDLLDPQLIWLGVSTTTYSFVRRDAHTDGPEGDADWNSMWQEFKQFRPNLVVMGENMFKVAAIRPGEVVTVKGMCTKDTRVFQVTQIIPGDEFAPPHHY